VPGRHLRKKPTGRHIPVRRWPRRVLVTVNVFAALALITVGSAYGYARWRLDSIRTVAAPHLSRVPSTAHKSDGLVAENILLIGNETRAGLTNPAEIQQFGSPQIYSGSLSDVIMILHIDPVTNKASILSIPRDLFLPMPPGSPVGPYQKVDAALNDGTHGPDNLIQAITDDLGIPINHYIELNFDGFQSTVNAIGGINVDFPEPLFDGTSLLNISTTGCQHLNGTQALALVRARHLQYDPPGVNVSDKSAWPYDPESDLSRIVRDHTFLRILATTVESKGFTNPFRANDLIGAVINQITIDPGLRGQLLSLISHYRHLNPNSVPETTLPVTQVGGASGYYYAGAAIGDVDFPVQPADNQVIAAWDPTSLPAPVNPTSVTVRNITSTDRLATQTGSALTADGIKVVATVSATSPATTTETLIHYHPGQVAAALAVMAHLSGAVMLQSDATVPAGTVTVDAGSLLAVTAPPTAAATTPATTATTAPATTTPSTTTVPTSPTTAPSAARGPTPGGQTPSSSTDQLQPWDPRPCP
jgi:LCP family protein required for cell wall assembly